MDEAKVMSEEPEIEDSELEPVVLAKITEATGSENVPGEGDWVDNIVWGQLR